MIPRVNNDVFLFLVIDSRNIYFFNIKGMKKLHSFTSSCLFLFRLFFLPCLVLLHVLQVKKSFRDILPDESDSVGDWVPDGSSMFASMTSGDELTYTLSSLQPSSFYKVEISAKNALGSSHPTFLVFRTADYADGKSFASYLLLFF